MYLDIIFQVTFQDHPTCRGCNGRARCCVVQLLSRKLASKQCGLLCVFFLAFQTLVFHLRKPEQKSRCNTWMRGNGVTGNGLGYVSTFYNTYKGVGQIRMCEAFDFFGVLGNLMQFLF